MLNKHGVVCSDLPKRRYFNTVFFKRLQILGLDSSHLPHLTSLSSRAGDPDS